MPASPKKSFVLRLDESTYKALERWAADEFRSVNGQMEWLLAHALRQHGRIPPERGKRGEPTAEPGAGDEPT